MPPRPAPNRRPLRAAIIAAAMGILAIMLFMSIRIGGYVSLASDGDDDDNDSNGMTTSKGSSSDSNYRNGKKGAASADNIPADEIFGGDGTGRNGNNPRDGGRAAAKTVVPNVRATVQSPQRDDDNLIVQPIVQRQDKPTTDDVMAGDDADSTSSSRSRKIRHITVQTGETPPWCRMLLSYFLSQPTDAMSSSSSTNDDKQRGLTIHNIGWGRKYAHSARPAWLLDWLNQKQQKDDLTDDDILMFADGGDTLYTGIDSRRIAASFDKLAAKRVDVDAVTGGLVVAVGGGGGNNDANDHTTNPSLPALLFNAEANCYHQQTFQGSWGPKKGRCLSAYRRHHNKLKRRLLLGGGGGAKIGGEAEDKNAHTSAVPSNIQHLATCSHNNTISPKFKYLNAGAWIGRVWAVKEVFASIKKIVDADKSLWCDQSVIGGVLLKGTFSEWVMGIDTENRFFLPIYHLDEKNDFCPYGKPPTTSGASSVGIAGGGDNSGPSSSAFPHHLTLCHSNQTPAVLHFNGKSEKMARFLTHRTAWWQDAAAHSSGSSPSSSSAYSKQLVADRVLASPMYLHMTEALVKSKCPNVALPP